METAHVLFMDIVGYSRLSMDQQRDSFQALQELVRATPELRRLLDGSDTLSLPTGDGMALVFFHDPVTPVRCAVDIAGSVRQRQSLPLRMGLHTGPVYRVEDINTNRNVSGAAINIAQRIMDCGDAGHILLSREIAGLCQQAGAWPLQDLGECDGKHGERLHLFNLYTGEVGNPRLPQKLGAQLATDPRSRKVAHPRVALLYKRNAQPDNALLDVLEERLRAAGCIPFVDRHLEIGVTWAREIEHKIRDADAVIPLISAASVQSEMLALEVQTAAETSQSSTRSGSSRRIRTGWSRRWSGPCEMARGCPPSPSSDWSPWGAQCRWSPTSTWSVLPTRSFAPPWCGGIASCWSRVRGRWARPHSWRAGSTRPARRERVWCGPTSRS
jgi:class 3 adenylate cyclase